MIIKKLVIFSLILSSNLAFALESDKALQMSIKACDAKVDRAIESATSDGECHVNLANTCDKSLYNLDRLHKRGFTTYMDQYSRTVVTWCKDRSPQSINPNDTKTHKKEYCPFPKKGKKNVCKDKK